MFVRSTYFPRFTIRASQIRHIVLTKFDAPNTLGDVGYSLHLHMDHGVFQSEIIYEDPEHIMQTITTELNGEK